MSACVIGHITVKDEEKWAQYRAQVPGTLAPWGAELLFRGQLAAVLDGQHRHSDTVVIRFPDQAAADGWHASPAYQALIPLRREAANLDLLTFND
ncbi:MAG: DUF1330 domain-containing protein [Betaproteobacteria bacterium HGW-Betaproteobacteria-12]|nr:MAG: DUF1330 domain-containing protein [Betaproteobacteria bacterium HGW-Betaproteobacteria-12]